MSIGKKWMVVASVMATGIGTALFFRKDASQATRRQSSLEDSPFRQHVERRVADDAAQARGVNRPPSDAWQAPSIAQAPVAQVPAASRPTFQRQVNSVGALLAPVESVVEDQPLDADPLVDQRRWDGADESLSHLIVDGDTLSKLAAQYLGASDRYLEIFELNRGLLMTPDLLPIGVVIKIPSVSSAPADEQQPVEVPDSMPKLELVPVQPRGVDLSEPAP